MIDFGLLMFSTDYAIAPDVLAKEAEAHGFESLFLPEHTHIPASRQSPWPGGDELPQEYWHTYDPFVALSMAAAVTEKLKLGTGISLITERDPHFDGQTSCQPRLLVKRSRGTGYWRWLEC